MRASPIKSPDGGYREQRERSRATGARWILVMPNIPSSPSYARVKIWRRLQSVGAVGLKNSVYVLPNREDCVEVFQWIAREIVELGGQASLCESRFFDSATDDDIDRKFAEERNELCAHADGMDIEAVRADLLDFSRHLDGPASLCVCMGDTLTHLESLNQARRFFQNVFERLGAGGKFVLTFRDLSVELKDLDRFIPLRSEADRVFTCFLEYEPEHVKVHDLLYLHSGGKWRLKKSCYRKCRIPFEWTKQVLGEVGFDLPVATLEKGLVTIIASKKGSVASSLQQTSRA